MDEQIEQIKNSLRQIMQAIAQRGQPLSPQLKDMLAQVLRHSGDRITQLRQGQPPREQPTPEGADLLWILSGANPDIFTRYLSTVPDRVLNTIASDPNRVQVLVNQLSQKVTLPAGEVEMGIPHADLNSSNIYGFSYSPRNGVLKVRFQGDGVYEYQGVPPQIFKAFQAGAVPAKTNGQNEYGRWWISKVPSLGASFYELIRDQFPFRKVS